MLKARLLGLMAGAVSLTISPAEAQNKMHRDAHVEPIETEVGLARFFGLHDDAAAKTQRAIDDIRYEDLIEPYVPNGSTLDLTDTSTSIAGYHYIFEQHINGTDVFGTRVAVNTDKNGAIVSVLSRVFDPNLVIAGRSFPDEMAVLDWCKLHWDQGRYRLEPTYYYNGSHLIPTYVAEIRRNDLAKLFILDQNLFTLYEDDLNFYAHGAEQVQDSTVNAYVFWPDPLTRANVNYGPPYIDNNDQDAAVLNNERNMVTFKAGRDASGTYNLSGNNIQISDFSSPSSNPLQSPSNQWDYSRSNQEFEEINAYYHLDTYIIYLRSLGFTQAMNYVVPVDVHALQGADNAMFSPDGNGEGQLFFGEGGVDDAEDTDVIIHELGHAISNNLSNSNMGNERRTLDEAIGDYTAVSYTASIVNYQTDRVFSWDGHNEYWNGRMCTSSKCHDQLSFSGSIYSHTDIWCAALSEIASNIGRSTTDQLLFESMYSYNVNMTMKDAAQLFVLADSMINGGTHFNAIANAFSNYCLYDYSIGISEVGNMHNWEVLNSAGFISGEALIIDFPQALETGHWTLYDVSGRMVKSQSFDEASRIQITGYDLHPGVFVLWVENHRGHRETYRIVR